MKPDDSTDEAYVNAAKRQPAVSWLAMLLLAALIVGAALTTWKWREATNALAEAQQEAKSRVGINEFFIEDLLGQAHSNSQTDPDIKLRTVLRRSSKNVGKRFEDDPETEAEVRFQVGRVLYGLAEHRDALEHFREAYEIRTKLFGEEHAETMQVLFRVGKAEKGLGNHEVAIEIFDRVADYYRKNTNPDTANLFDAMIMKSGSLSSLGRHAEAEKVAVEFVDFAHDDPDLDIKNGMEQLAKTLYDQKKYAACETVIIGRLNMPDKSSQKLSARKILALCRMASGDIEAAKKTFAKLLEIHESEYGREHEWTMVAAKSYADALKQSGQVEESLAILNKYLPLSKLQAGDEELGLKKIQEEIKDEAADRHGETSR